MRPLDSPSRFRRRRWRWALLAGIGLLALSGGCAGWLYGQLHRSLPQLDGAAVLRGLAAPVTVERDALGVPTIRGDNRLDVARVTGFVHAQERFFQMDLSRRAAAGELAALVGSAALDLDRANRLHRFRHRARRVLGAASAEDRALIGAYVGGVNAGLAALASPPFEYLLLRIAPEPWQAEDTLLAIYAMYLDLQASQRFQESARGVLHERLPESLAAFLDPPGTEWDAPLQGEPFEPLPPPDPEVFDLRRNPSPLLPGEGPRVKAELATAGPPPPAFGPRGIEPLSEAVSGSNNWAVAGRLTAHGGALLANDMHLALRVPNTWYRAALIFPDDRGRARRVEGVMLPGAPAIVAGSNGHLAWGFTNSRGDWSDLVVLEPTSDGAGYQTPEGPKQFERARETLAVRGGSPETLEILATAWGPVVDRDDRGRQRALRWVAHDLRAVNLGLLALERADALETALDIANRAGVPAQNILLASADGRIAWTLAGPIPRRFGHDGHLPSSWADGRRGWSGWLEPPEYPRIADPPNGRLWTANGRVVDGAWLAQLGDGGYVVGARARQIRDGLLARERFDEMDFLKLQLDDRALFLARWQRLLLDALTAEAVRADPRRDAVKRLAVDWGGRAAVDSVGYRLVRAFREEVRDRVLGPLTAACWRADPRFDYGLLQQHEGPLWQLVTRRPPHLLDPRYPDWPALLLQAADAARDKLTADGRPLAARTWGDHNRIEIRHPFSRILPWLSGWLDMPALPLPGDLYMPRVQTLGSGASERLVVAPGRETAGILHMPGGQSGHPLSPFYRAGFEAWAKGEPAPLKPGPVRYRLEFTPESDSARAD